LQQELIFRETMGQPVRIDFVRDPMVAKGEGKSLAIPYVTHSQH
jgi:hypothetical protein